LKDGVVAAPGDRWTKDDRGADVMPPMWSGMLDWLIQGDQRVPEHQYQWCEEHGVAESTLRGIKRDPRFIQEWDRRLSKMNIHPQRTQGVVDALHAKAVKGDVKAASLYLQYIDKFTPKRVVVAEEAAVDGLSDEALAVELEASVRHLRVVADVGGDQ
jgi:hypothetical protein